MDSLKRIIFFEATYKQEKNCLKGSKCKKNKQFNYFQSVLTNVGQNLF